MSYNVQDIISGKALCSRIVSSLLFPSSSQLWLNSNIADGMCTKFQLHLRTYNASEILLHAVLPNRRISQIGFSQC